MIKRRAETLSFCIFVAILLLTKHQTKYYNLIYKPLGSFNHILRRQVIGRGEASSIAENHTQKFVKSIKAFYANAFIFF